MFPVLFTIGDFPITSFGLMMFFSFLSGAWILSKGLERYGFHRDLAWDMLAWIAIGGILGAKAYYLALNWEDLVRNPLGEILSRGGLVWYGGLIGGVTAYFLQVRARKLPMAVLYDATAPALAVAYAVGRLGCFLVGDDYGRYTTNPIGIAFPQGAPPSTAGNLRYQFGDTSIPASIPDSMVVTVHPTQLYEIGLALIMFVILWNVAKKALKPGYMFALFLAMYAVERFLIEFVRAKGDRFVFGLSTSQVMSILTLIAAGIIWYTQRNKPVWNPANAPAAVRAPKARTSRATA